MEASSAQGPPRPRGANRRGEATRAALVDAGWRLVEQMSLGELFASLTATDVAREAGRTTGAFFHHFETFDEYVAAMVEAFAEGVVWSEIEIDEEDFGDLSDGVAASMRRVSRLWWDGAVGDEAQCSELIRLMLLTAVGDRSLRSDGTLQADLVRSVLWEQRNESFSQNLEWLWETLGREPLEPFDLRSTALVMNAVLVGLRLAHRVGVEVDPEVVAELGPALATVTSRPKGATGARSARDAELEPAVPATATFDPFADGADDLLRAIRAVLPADGAELTWQLVAEAAGVSVPVAMSWFGSARRAAALTARLELPELHAQASRFIDTDPTRAVADGLVAIVRASRSWGPVTAALLGERAHQQQVGRDQPVRNIRDLVPLGDLVLEPLMAVWSCGADCRPCRDDAELAVDLSLQLGASRPRTAPSDLAEVVMRAVPSLRGPNWVAPPGR